MISFLTLYFIFVKLQIKKDVIDTNGVHDTLFMCTIHQQKNQANKKHIRNNCILTTTFIVQS